MIRLLGALLAGGGCVFWGAWEGRRLRERVRLLDDLAHALELLERELSLSRTGLPELLERLSGQGGRQSRALFAACREEMKRGNSFTYAWGQALRDAELPPEERGLLAVLADVLGRYDARGQEEAVARLRGELDRRLVRMREQTGQQVRVLGALGAAAGGFLVLTLL